MLPFLSTIFPKVFRLGRLTKSPERYKLLRYVLPKPPPSFLAKSLKEDRYNVQTPGYGLFLRRLYCNRPPRLELMEFDNISWPSFFKTIKNWLYVGIIIRPSLDPDFNLKDFIEGTKQAVEIVSNCISEGKLDKLEGLLTPECLQQIQEKLPLLNATQRHDIAVARKDIYFSFPFELGVLVDRGGRAKSGEQKREVEVTVVHHVLRGHAEMMARGDPVPLNIGVLPEYRDKISIVNYRFIRDYSQGVNDQWTINVVNHFKPSEVWG